jgi:hypothetical protein
VAYIILGIGIIIALIERVARHASADLAERRERRRDR